MTMICALTLSLRPSQPANFSMFSGAVVRDWFLSMIRECAPEQLNRLTEGDAPRPFTLSPLIDPAMPGKRPILIPERIVDCRIVGLDDDACKALAALKAAITSNPIIQLGEAAFHVENQQADETTDDVLLQQHMLTSDRPRRFTLELVTPTAFRSHGVMTPLPLPEWVFGGLVDRWNTHCSVKLHTDVRRFAQECVGIDRYRMHSVRVNFGEGGYSPITGGMGRVTYHLLNADPYWGRAVWALAAYANYAGIGLRTAVGMGQARLIWPSTADDEA
ncbi:MAG: CRISPR system precrRNA processing endoribonuclease RAMP protein Cas6 [Anaerolineae bacterium]|nr:CRISPR system precrRNA processing endoribonuclease RAMP protein Cas6 [Anaerolineae bacterium]